MSLENLGLTQPGTFSGVIATSSLLSPTPFSEPYPQSAQVSSSLSVDPAAQALIHTHSSRSLRTIRGTARNDVINTQNLSGNIRILAGGGSDRLIIGQSTIAYGQAGNDTIDARIGRGGNTLYGDDGGDRLYARQNDILVGGLGRDNLWGGLGRNRLRGGAGADRFWLANGRLPNQANTVLDFKRGQDLLMINRVPEVTSFADLTLVRQGANTQIRAKGQAIATLVNVLPGQLDYTSFSFFQGTPIRINFQPSTAPAPQGYRVDSGQKFTTTRRYGWVIQGTHTPLDMRNRIFDRNTSGVEQRLDSGIRMQPGGEARPGAWEYALANGRYSVTVSVGDRALTSTHRIQAEGVTLVPGFRPSTLENYKLATATVTVADGKLTLNAQGGIDTRLNFVEIIPIAPGPHPRVVSSPLANASNVNRGAAITISDLSLVGVGIGVDGRTLAPGKIQLYRTRDNAPVTSVANTSGGNDTIVIQPTVLLDANTQYTLRITDGVKDVVGRSFLPYSLTFTTGTAVPDTLGVNFDRTEVFTGAPITSLVMSPNNQFLYATALDGQVRRWTVNAQGGLANLKTFTVAGGSSPFPNRDVIGIAVDPTNPNVLWISHNAPTGTSLTEDFTGKITRITIQDSTNFTGIAQDYVVGLPRSSKEHFSNSLRFGPDGLLYLAQGSNTSTGSPDPTWSLRPERLLSAAVLQINPRLTPPAGGFNVQTNNYTTDGGVTTTGNYNPYAANAPVKIYATGIRNGYDFVFHSNGSLYVPGNGPGAGGSTPDDPNTPANEALSNVGSRPDYLFRVVQGGYYGHPNSARGEYILNGGNPTSGEDPGEVVSSGSFTGYPIGTAPDPNYRGSIYTFGFSRSTDGIIEYQSNTFGGVLRNRLLITEYSAGDDIIALTLDASGNVAAKNVLASGFANPLDLIENTATGDIYVNELYPGNGTIGRIILLRPAS
ncbi:MULTISPECIES: Ig-like domain-containing protein [unclassified Leptolyngbya]|uniref:Ig-like domain-containing protein n=1 Tax=unclassified Leptolyngbya TaxID=2650499 RepID=UPI0016820C34|nr:MULTISPECIES: Ig-like domain-containing protein [unclassified Leptolyngbya]MBD1911315.1 PQQ-dependent sugar dehydrogenase [Leptolyngbya sp. FACHB-8]MBD2156667.1 PQQ-dependent sugar dehydrogenase [Leptolyngbya sp. FACHB-16]